ncbi:tetratricopeptide repeat protein [Zavarzinia aquatilis]|nr:tetratricopeptide repeat protein [Zavarzinia aquatilis]
MPKSVLVAIIVVLIGVAGFFAYQAYQKDDDTLSIQIGPNGVKIDPPGQ